MSENIQSIQSWWCVPYKDKYKTWYISISWRYCYCWVRVRDGSMWVDSVSVTLIVFSLLISSRLHFYVCVHKLICHMLIYFILSPLFLYEVPFHCLSFLYFPWFTWSRHLQPEMSFEPAGLRRLPFPSLCPCYLSLYACCLPLSHCSISDRY